MVNRGSLKIAYSTFIPSVLLIVFYGCGPRSGIHTKENTESEQPTESPKLLCGNAEMEVSNYNWAQRVLNITGDGQRGSKLFKQNCAVCHSLTDTHFNGPGLRGMYYRLPEPKGEWLKNYILNSDKMYKQGDAHASELRKLYPNDRMTVFEGQLSDKEINEIIIYTVGNTK